MTFPAERNIIQRLGEFARRIRDIFSVSRIRGVERPPVPPPEIKNREERKLRQKRDVKKKSKLTKSEKKKLRVILKEEDEELKEIEQGRHHKSQK